MTPPKTLDPQNFGKLSLLGVKLIILGLKLIILGSFLIILGVKSKSSHFLSNPQEILVDFDHFWGKMIDFRGYLFIFGVLEGTRIGSRGGVPSEGPILGRF